MVAVRRIGFSITFSELLKCKMVDGRHLENRKTPCSNRLTYLYEKYSDVAHDAMNLLTIKISSC